MGSATTSFTLDSDDELTATSSSSGGFVNSYSYNAAGDQTNRTLSGTSWTLAYTMKDNSPPPPPEATPSPAWSMMRWEGVTLAPMEAQPLSSTTVQAASRQEDHKAITPG